MGWFNIIRPIAGRLINFWIIRIKNKTNSLLLCRGFSPSAALLEQNCEQLYLNILNKILIIFLSIVHLKISICIFLLLYGEGRKHKFLNDAKFSVSLSIQKWRSKLLFVSDYLSSSCYSPFISSITLHFANAGASFRKCFVTFFVINTRRSIHLERNDM